MGIQAIFNLNTVGAFIFTVLVIGLFFHPPAFAAWENFLRRRSLTQIRCAVLGLLIVAGCMVWPDYFASRVWLPFWFIIRTFQWTNFFIHEAGHVYFGLLGVETVHVLGGTLFQLLVPLLTAFFLAMRGYTVLAVLGCYWFGTQFPEIAAYVADAPLMKLKAADGGRHDWNVLLTKFDLLSASEAISQVFSIAGCVILVTATLALLKKGSGVLVGNCAQFPTKTPDPFLIIDKRHM